MQAMTTILVNDLKGAVSDGVNDEEAYGEDSENL